MIYTTDQAHFAIAKAARLVGIPRRMVRTVATDQAGRMDPAGVIRALEEDRARGYEPFCLAATVGTTNTGIVDPLTILVDIAERERLWFHVDAAYGGFFRLTARGNERLKGIERADSLALDPHKGMFLPFGTGCLLVQDPQALLHTHAGDEAVFFRDVKSGQATDFADLSPELTRPARGLRLWLPLHLHGVGAFRRELDEKLDLAQTAWDRLSDMQGISAPAPPELSIVTFRAQGWPDDDDHATETLVREVCADGRFRLTTTLVNGQVSGRLAILGYRTSAIEVEELLHRVHTVTETHLA
ncbi:MAG: pyridoxal-dependent decarboxylase [Aliidongia sp.]